MVVIGAVDMALWDLKGKELNTPAHNLLGGKSRTGVVVYGYANGRAIDETVEEVGKYKEMGCRAVPRAKQLSGPAIHLRSCQRQKDKLFYDPAEKACRRRMPGPHKGIFFVPHGCLKPCA
jgi:mannonate dehydratase